MNKNENNYKNAINQIHASEELKKKADFITLSNNNSGVAYFINKYIINN